MTKQFIRLQNDREYRDLGPQQTIVIPWLMTASYFAPGGIIGFVFSDTTLNCRAGKFFLKAGMYFASPDSVNLGGGSGLLFMMYDYRPQFQIGGPIEPEGRLKYIDGCRDSLLIAPARCGDPCFNALYFPPGIKQTMHTHPSLRAGMIVSGRGKCVTPEATIDLTPGLSFVIETDGQHYFTTEKEPMVVVAYHPDSDFGPKDEDHPMINRTIVGGVSAREIESIRTK